jgi:hypothetical protein
VLSKGLEARRAEHGRADPNGGRGKRSAERSGSDPLLKAKLEQGRASKFFIIWDSISPRRVFGAMKVVVLAAEAAAAGGGSGGD